MLKKDSVNDHADSSDDEASLKKGKKTVAGKKPAKKWKTIVAKTNVGKKQTPVKKEGKTVKKKGGETNKNDKTSAVKKGGKTVQKKKSADDSFEYRTPKTSTSLATMAEKSSTPIRSGRCGESNQGKGVVTTRCSLSKRTLVRHGMTWSMY